MSNRLIYDYTRCHGQMCPQKESCKRFLTIALDTIAECNRRNPVLYSYAASLNLGNEESECESFIEADQD